MVRPLHSSLVDNCTETTTLEKSAPMHHGNFILLLRGRVPHQTICSFFFFFLVCVFLFSSLSNTLPVYATQCLTLEWKYHQDKRCPTKTKQLDALPASPKVRLVNVKWSSINLQITCCDSHFFKTNTLSILHLEPHRTAGRQKIGL